MKCPNRQNEQCMFREPIGEIEPCQWLGREKECPKKDKGGGSDEYQIQSVAGYIAGVRRR